MSPPGCSWTLSIDEWSLAKLGRRIAFSARMSRDSRCPEGGVVVADMPCESREVGVPTTLGDDSRFSNVRGGTSLLLPMDWFPEERVAVDCNWFELGCS